MFDEEMECAAAEVRAPQRSMFRFALTLAAAMLLMLTAAVVFSEVSAEAANYNLTSTAPLFNWTEFTRWNSGTGGTYPGQNQDDTVTITMPGSYVITITSDIPNNVTITSSCGGCRIEVQSGGNLGLIGTNTLNHEFRVTTGGVVDNGNLLDTTGILRLSGGTINNSSAIDIKSGGLMEFQGGTLGGLGTLTLASGATMRWNGLVSAMTLEQGVMSINGALEYNSTGNVFSANDSSTVKINAGGTFDLQNNLAINSNTPASSRIWLNGGTLNKTIGGGDTNANLFFQNDGTVSLTNGGLILNNGGSHSGNFAASSTRPIVLNSGTHTFTGNSSITGAQPMQLKAIMNINGGVTVNAQKFQFLTGTIGGNGAFTSTGSFDWAGGTIDSGTGLVSLGGTTSISGTGAPLILNARTLSLSGTINYTATSNGLTINNGGLLDNLGTFNYTPGGALGAITLASGGTIRVNPSFSFNLTNDQSLLSSGGTITNNGTFQKNGGSGSSNVAAAINNNSTVAASSGILRLGGGGAHIGAFNTTSPSNAVDFAGGTHQMNAGASWNGGGTIKISGADVVLNAPILTSTPFFFASGNLSGASNLTINAQATWSGGAMTGSGITAFNGLSTVDGAFGLMALDGRQLTVGGTMTYSPLGGNVLTIENGGLLHNLATVNITGDYALNADGTATITNDGTIDKTAGVGNATIAPALTNNGTVNVGAGQLWLLGGGTNTTTLAMNGNVLAIIGGTFQHNSGSITGTAASALKVKSSGTLSINTAASIPNVFLEPNGTINGAAQLTVTNFMGWTGGTMSGGGTTLISGTLDLLNPTALPRLDNRVLTISATMNYGGASANPLNVDNGSIINVNGTFDIEDDSNMVSGTAGNAINIGPIGVLQKIGGASGAVVPLPVNMGAGTFPRVRSSSGTLILAGGGGMAAGGALDAVNTGNFIDLAGGTFTVGGGSFIGAGAVRLMNAAATLQVNSNLTSTNFELKNGTLKVAGSQTFQVFTGFKWTGGTAELTGTLRPHVSVIAPTSPISLIGSGMLTNAGTLDYNADNVNFLTLGGTAVLDNEPSSSFNINNDTIIAGTTANQLTNTGNLMKLIGAGTARIDVPVAVTFGSIGATSGTLGFSGGGTISGATINTGSDGTIQFDGAGKTYVIGTGATVSGTGTIRIASATTNVNGNLNIPNLDLLSGALGGTGSITLDGGVWIGGNMEAGGTTSVNSGKTFELATGTPKFLRRNFTNNGLFFSSVLPAAMTFENAALFTNNGTVELQTNTNFFCNCSPSPARFDNAAGILRHMTAAGTSNFLMPFDNDAAVDVQTGLLKFLAGGTHTGTFAVADNTALSFEGTSHSFSAATVVSGAGAVVFGTGGVSTFAGNLSLSGTNALTAIRGNVDFTGPNAVNTGALQIDQGTLGGTSAISVTGSSLQSLWSGGIVAGSGAFNISGGVVFEINGSMFPMLLDGRTITNNGTILYATPANALTLSNNASIANNSIFALQSDTALNAGPGTNTFTNGGTFQKGIAAGTTPFGPAFTNSNIVNLVTGTVAFNGGFTQLGGSTTLAAGSGINSPFLVDFDGGTVNGSGTIGANVRNDAVVSPGFSPGILTVNGNYTQTGNGVLNIDMSGNTPGTGYDRLAVTGNAAFDGTLNVTLVGGYVPADNDVFDVVTYASRSGIFANENLPPFGTGGSFTSSYNASEYRLTAQITQADVQVTQTAPPSAQLGDNVTFTVAVKNSGPDSATNVSLSDTMTGGNLVSATSTQGTCNTVSTPIVCSIGTMTSGQNVVVTIVVNANALGTITNSAVVSATEFDNVTANNSTGSANVSVGPGADLGIAVTEASDPVTGGTNTTYTVTLTNAGPSSATSANVALTMTGATITASGAGFTCSGSPTNVNCGAPSLAPGVYTITVNVVVPAAPGVMTLVATASSATNDPDGTDNSQTENTAIDPPAANLTIAKSGPSVANIGDTISYIITVTNSGPSAAANVVVSDPTPAGLSFNGASGDCSTDFPCTIAGIPAGVTKTITASYTVLAGASGQTIVNNTSVSTTTAESSTADNSASKSTSIGCLNTAPSALSPAGTVPVSGTLTWSHDGPADRHDVYLGEGANGCNMPFGNSLTTSLAYSDLAPNTTYSWRVESVLGECPVQTSSCVTFTTNSEACPAPAAPIASVVGESSSGKAYQVEWKALQGATKYEVDEATNPEFANATTRTASAGTTSLEYEHEVTSPAAFYYRVRAFFVCGTSAGPNAVPVRVVIIPLPPKTQDNPSVNVPVGTTEIVVQEVFIAGIPARTVFYSARTDREWLTVTPPSGVLPPEGVTLNVLADPANLPNGTFTATVIVTINDANGARLTANAVTTVSVPVSVNLVTPVTPVTSKPETSQHALIIPAVGHSGGLNSHWQSDVRITNAGFRSYKYRLTFTPSGGTAEGVKQTDIKVDAGATTALDDIVKNWFGRGSLGDGTNGMLEIVPLEDAANASLVTVASSRTYNVAENGTLGQFIPAIPFKNFIGKAVPNGLKQVLSLQQVAQNARYRTNVGVANASPAGANLLVKILGAAGNALASIPVQLAAGQQLQMNGLLAAHGITADDARVEVEVTGGDGKVTAYASVIDGGTQDPLLVSGQLLGGSGSTRFVLPGVANVDNGFAKWRTDMRVFNFGSAPVSATLTFYPSGHAPRSATILAQAGEVLALDNVIHSLFAGTNLGGVVHLTTSQPSSFVVTGRTYNLTDAGTFGQFIPAVTPDEATGLSGRTLHILQVEDSTRYRTNIGLAEVTGKDTVVELQIVLPDSKITPVVQIPLAANEFRQFNPIRELGLGNVYNARVAVRVISGAGRVTAYGSVIDEATGDPTYVPAQ